MYEYCGNVTSAISSGQIVPITDYLDSYGSDMKSQISDSDWKCVTFNGDIYGVPANKEKATGWGFAMNKEMADATGIDYRSIKTEEELEPLLEKVKEMYAFTILEEVQLEKIAEQLKAGVENGESKYKKRVEVRM